MMALFVIERNFAEQLDADHNRLCRYSGWSTMTSGRWIYSFLSADKKKTYCLYEAANPEAIMEAASTAGTSCGCHRRRR